MEWRSSSIQSPTQLREGETETIVTNRASELVKKKWRDVLRKILRTKDEKNPFHINFRHKLKKLTELIDINNNNK